MVSTCTLTGIQSWFTCIEAGMPFTEGLCVAIFLIFFMIFKNYSLREALPAALWITTLSAGMFLGIGAINPIFVLACIILTGLSTLFQYMQNSAN